ncbi:MAG: hypothetical protein V8Q44_06995 [Alistipes ihumii]
MEKYDHANARPFFYFPYQQAVQRRVDKNMSVTLLFELFDDPPLPA